MRAMQAGAWAAPHSGRLGWQWIAAAIGTAAGCTRWSARRRTGHNVTMVSSEQFMRRDAGEWQLPDLGLYAALGAD